MHLKILKSHQLRVRFWEAGSWRITWKSSEMNELDDVLLLGNRFCYDPSSDEKVTVSQRKKLMLFFCSRLTQNPDILPENREMGGGKDDRGRRGSRDRKSSRDGGRDRAQNFLLGLACFGRKLAGPFCGHWTVK